MSKIRIKPYFDPTVPNMGLEKYGLVLVEGAKYREQMNCVSDIGGHWKAVNGLDESDLSVKNLEPEAQAARIKEIRETLARIEWEIAGNKIDPKDPDFNSKLTISKPQNIKFWTDHVLEVGNSGITLQPESKIGDLIKFIAIQNEGYSSVAPSLTAARSANKPYKFYLDREEETAAIRTELPKLRNKAGKELDTIFNKNTTKLMYVLKVLEPDSLQYKKNTPNDVLYEKADDFINGRLSEKDKRKAPQRFLDTMAMNMEDLKIWAITKDSDRLKLIHTSQGHVKHTSTGTVLGRNLSEAINYLKNPVNEDIYKQISTKVEEFWSN